MQDETPGSDIQQGTVILPKPQENDESGDSQNGEYPSAQDPLPQKPGDTKKPEEPDKAEDGKIRVRTKIMLKRLPRTQSRRRIKTIIMAIILQFQAIPRFLAGNTARYGSAIWSWAVC